MTTNINFYGKPFGAPLLPNKMTSDGWSIADARHIGGHRVVDTIDDLYELYDWQLVNPSALLNNDTDSAVGQKWYVKGDGTYMLKNYDNRKSKLGWAKVEDINGNAWADLYSDSIISVVSQVIGPNSRNNPNGAIVLDANGHIPSKVDAFKTVNGQSILKTNGGASDIKIDLSLFVIPANNTLPTTGINEKKIYLIKNTGVDASTQNVYTEYMYVNGAWEKLGEYKATIDLSGYLTKDAAETQYVKRSGDSPAVYTLSSYVDINNTYDSGAIVTADTAANVKLVKSVYDNSMILFSRKNHSHIVTINGEDKIISEDTVDLGTYVTAAEFTTKAQAFTYSKTEIDKKIEDVTASSLGISTLTNTEIDTMFTQIFG